jgi:hypothetical protein
MRNTVVTVTLVGLVAVGLAVWHYARVDVAPATLPEKTTTPAAVGNQRSRLGVAVQYVSWGDPNRPDLTIRSARAAAEQGSDKAMLDLGRALHLCAELQAVTEQQLIQKQVQLAQVRKLVAKDNRIGLDPKELAKETDAKTVEQLTIKEACENVSAENAAQWLAWLERAADAGNLDAKRELAYAVLSLASDSRQALEQADDLGRLKRKAFGYLNDVLKAGDCTVSTQMELLAPSPTEAYGYAIVSTQWGRDIRAQIAPPELAAENNAFMERELAKKAARLSASQVAIARQQAAGSYASCRR